MTKITLTINGSSVTVDSGKTILDAAKSLKIKIPHLCHESRLDPCGACRLCLVEVKGARGFVPSCHAQAADGMEVTTNSDELIANRKFILELLLSDHRQDCMTCDSNSACKLQRYAYEHDVDVHRFVGKKHECLEVNDANKVVERDPSKCILCGRCVRMCNEVVGAQAIDFVGRGFDTNIAPPYNDSLLDTTCELCGQCVSACPVGALSEKMATGKGRSPQLKKVRTTCPYCGVGCTYDLNVNKDGRIVKVTSEIGGVPNNGNLCIKGRFSYDFVQHPDRLKKPLMRKDGELVEVEWDEAIAYAANKMNEIKEKYGPDSLGFVSSCRSTNEANYVMQKLARAVYGTNNIDQCARTCHAPTVAGLAMSFGSGAMTNSISEISGAELLFVIGSNPTEAHPVIGFQMKKAMRNGAKVIVVDPRETWMAKNADLHLPIQPGSDVPLMNAMMNVIITEGIEDKEFVASRTEDFEVLKEMVMQWPPERAAEVCKVPAEDIKTAARMYATTNKAGIYYTLGLTEHICGTDNVRSTANLAMLTGHMGIESAGVNPLRGQNNVQGGCDMGAGPTGYHGYQKYDAPGVHEKFCDAYGAALPTNHGYTITDMVEKAAEGKLKALYIMGEDHLMSEPNIKSVEKAFENLEILIIQDIFFCETAKVADLVLPAASYAEKDGTFTNSERRVQRIRKAIEPIGESRSDWEIVCQIAQKAGYDRMNYASASEVWDELADLAPIFNGIRYDRIEKVGLQWPCFDREHPGTKFLHVGKFTRGLGKFHALDYRPPAEEPCADYPFYLTTGRILYHYNVGTMTLRSVGSEQKEPVCFVEVNAVDAEKLGIANGDDIKVSTRRGELVVQARVGNTRVKPGRLWMPFHYPDKPANLLTNDAFDNITRTAEYKVCAAKIAKP